MINLRTIHFELLSMLACLASGTAAQESGTQAVVSGYVLDGYTATPVHGANCRILGTRIGSATNENGFFAIRHALQDTILIQISFIGYKRAIVEVPPAGMGSRSPLFVNLYLDAIERMREYDPIPAEWKFINAENKFSFRIPSELTQKEAIGVDSYIGIWESPRFRVQFEYGYHAHFESNLRDYSEVSTVIGCKQAILKTFRFKNRQDDFLYVAAADFDFPFTFWVAYKSKEDKKGAMTIVHSILFP